MSAYAKNSPAVPGHRPRNVPMMSNAELLAAISEMNRHEEAREGRTSRRHDEALTSLLAELLFRSKERSTP